VFIDFMMVGQHTFV